MSIRSVCSSSGVFLVERLVFCALRGKSATLLFLQFNVSSVSVSSALRHSCLIAGLLLAVSSLPVSVHAQTPARGMTWDLPGTLRQAEAELTQMHEMGVTAVRTRVIEWNQLLVLADTLGMQFYQELPIEGLTAAALNDTLPYARRVLRAALQRARRHLSTRHFGIARLSDTSTEEAAAYVQTLAELVRQQGPPGSRTYYISEFVESDALDSLVDLVLLDARDEDNPANRLRRWNEAQTSPAGLLLGSWIDPDAEPGYRVPGSEEYQARYLENKLRTVLYGNVEPAVVFVDGWRDATASRLSVRHDWSEPYMRRYGLYGENRARPALDVVRGLYTGEQTVFALPPGDEQEDPQGWFVLIGWAVVLLLGGLYALPARLDHILRRFFVSHSFYIELIRRGRAVQMSTSLIVLACLSVCVGIIGTVALELVSPTATFAALFDALPVALQRLMLALVDRPAVGIVLIALLYGLRIVLWGILLVARSGLRSRLGLAPALMLALAPRWPLILLMIAALVALTTSYAPSLILAIVLLWLVVETVAHNTTLVDYAKTLRQPVVPSLLRGWLISLVVLGGVLAALYFAAGPDEVTFAWRRVRLGG